MCVWLLADDKANICRCGLVYAPICGHDGQTYSNACEAGCAGINIAVEGECEGDFHGSEDGCVCAMTYNPVCGKDGKTYGNQCEADCVKATVAAQGECAQPAPPQSAQSPAKAKDGCVCAMTYNPVCGKDGKTYGNQCEADCVKATVAAQGECAQPAPPQSAQSPAKAKDGCVCAMTYNPVCGKDGKTYGNQCEADCVKATVAAQGECAQPAPPQSAQSPAKAKDGCVCAMTYNPVCGKDGKTYGNQCEADCVKATVAAQGECAQPAPPQSAQSPAKAKDGCVCAMTYNPVCGKDGKTYGNQCEADCVKATVAAQGKCAQPAPPQSAQSPAKAKDGCVCAMTYNPVCGKDGKTYGNQCEADCVKATVAAQGECAQPAPPQPAQSPAKAKDGCVCAMTYNPVCGKDGKTYGNQCEADCVKATVAAQGECAQPAPPQSAQSPAKAKDGCVCAMTYNPVCGKDGKTYGNQCEADCVKATVAAQGECAQPAPPQPAQSPAKAKDGCVCAMTYNPVCGKDGKTYGNQCEADCVKATVAAQGECAQPAPPQSAQSPAKAKDGCVCAMTYNPVCGKDGKTYGNQCEADCVKATVAAQGECAQPAPPQSAQSPAKAKDGCVCAMTYNPVCGKDGKTYGNQCEADCVKATVAAQGECAQPAPPQPAQSPAKAKDGCVCAMTYNPVCGKDGKTYGNQCEADCVKATVAAQGECAQPAPPQSAQSPAKAKDGCVCAMTYNPVCGKDGKTYGNQCEADCVKATVAAQGECAQPAPPQPAQSPAKAKDGCVCAMTYNPVCGKDGKTYGNQCEADCVKATVAAQGECAQPAPPQSAQSPAKAKDGCVCAMTYNPVCGKDGKTYGNQCEADCVKATVAAQGECAQPAPPQSAQSPAKAKDGCVCAMTYNPVCGKDGKTYGNQCEADCVKATVAAQGECAQPAPPQSAQSPAKAKDGCVCAMTYNPVCGKDGKTYGNQCEADCVKATVAAQGECAQPAPPQSAQSPAKAKDGCVCAMTYNPVCGKDGKTYGNQCEADCVKATVAAQGECAQPAPPQSAQSPAKAKDGCVCAMTYNPVCGKDGKTYGNQCEADCVKATVAAQGECAQPAPPQSAQSPAKAKDGCVCAMTYNPVCGKDGKTYGNQCEADCVKATVAAQGECAQPAPPQPAEASAAKACSCSKFYAPVCGQDGITYRNLCLAVCSKVRAAAIGECRQGECACSAMMYDPVCGKVKVVKGDCAYKVSDIALALG